jgi:hypothetical protein
VRGEADLGRGENRPLVAAGDGERLADDLDRADRRMRQEFTTVTADRDVVRRTRLANSGPRARGTSAIVLRQADLARRFCGNSADLLRFMTSIMSEGDRPGRYREYQAPPTGAYLSGEGPMP